MDIKFWVKRLSWRESKFRVAPNIPLHGTLAMTKNSADVVYCQLQKICTTNQVASGKARPEVFQCRQKCCGRSHSGRLPGDPNRLHPKLIPSRLPGDYRKNDCRTSNMLFKVSSLQARTNEIGRELFLKMRKIMENRWSKTNWKYDLRHMPAREPKEKSTFRVSLWLTP